MDRAEEVIVGLFSRLREDLRAEPGVGLALKAQGRNVTLRIRSERRAEDERQPYFAVVVGLAETDGSFRVSYDPSGTPSAERQVTIVGSDSTDELHGLVRRYVEEERRRLIDHQRGT
jgi:hypothetical protein